MKKGFEDVLAELQAEMVAIYLEYVNNRADDIYIYCSCELSYFFNVFYKINGKVVQKKQLNEVLEDKIYDLSKEKQWSILHKGIEILKQLHNKCLKNLIRKCLPKKIHYKVKENKLQATYKYDLVWSNDDMLLPDDIFLSWFEEVRQENNADYW